MENSPCSRNTAFCQQWRSKEQLVLLSSVSLPSQVLQFAVIAVNVIMARLAVRITCAEKTVMTAPSIPSVPQEKSAAMTEPACRFVLQVLQVRMVLGLQLSAVSLVRCCYSSLLFPLWLASVVLAARTTASVRLELSCLNQQLTKRSCRPTCRLYPANQYTITLRQQITTILQRQCMLRPRRHIIQVILSNQPIILLQHKEASLLCLLLTISLFSKS